MQAVTYVILNKQTNTVLQITDNGNVGAGIWQNQPRQRWLAMPRNQQEWQTSFQTTLGGAARLLTTGPLDGAGNFPPDAQLIGQPAQPRHFIIHPVGSGFQILTSTEDNPPNADAATHAVALVPGLGGNHNAVLQEKDDMDDVQIWYLILPALFPVGLEPGTYIIRNNTTQTCLHLDNAAAGNDALARGRPQQNVNNQTWELVRNNNTGLWSFQGTNGQICFLRGDFVTNSVYLHNARRLIGRNGVAAADSQIFAIKNVPGTNNSYQILTKTMPLIDGPLNLAVNILTGADVLGINHLAVHNIFDDGAHVCVHHAAAQSWTFTRIA